MGYSTINKTKHGDCSICPNKDCSVIKVAKIYYCQSCYRSKKTSEALAKHKAKQSLPQLNSKVRMLSHSIDNKILTASEKQNMANLQKFFKDAAIVISNKPYCMECGKFIPSKFYRAATAHVLPKRDVYGFPSVSCNPENYLILGAGCGCHNKYDKSWEDAATMKVFPLAIEKFKILYPLIDKSEYKNIPEVFSQEIEPKC